MFFLTTAPAGLNTYGCSASGVWTQQLAGTQNTTVKSSGTLVGTRPVIDIAAGTGGLLATSDNGEELLVQSSIDTSIIETRAEQQAGTTLFCRSSSAAAPGAAYTCALSPTLSKYTTGMMLHWMPDASGAGGNMTLNVDTLGAVPVVQSDGLTNPSGSDIAANQLYALWYDGTVFRLPAVVGGTGSGGTTGPPGPVGPSPTVAGGAAALGLSPIASGECAPVVTAAATGALTTDNIIADFNADPTNTAGYTPNPNGMLTIVKYLTAGAVNFKVCNNTGSAVTPGAVTLQWRVVR
jgi:hypothetical protein